MPRAGPGGHPARALPPPLELLCLNALWSLGEGNVQDVRECVSPQRTLAYTTVMTLLERLTRKGLVSRRKTGRAFRYTPQAGRDGLRRVALREFLDAYFDGSVEQLLEFLGAPAGVPAPANGAAEAEPATLLDPALL